jgi:glycosyltransferase involved in cell wall biosynthesis
VNWLIPGKREAATLLVANERTRAALPRGACHRVLTIVENGVDLTLWKTGDPARADFSSEATRFVFVGRLVNWKAVDILLLAFKRATAQATVTLSIIGDGVERAALELQARHMNMLSDIPNQAGRVSFLGWMSQPDCAKHLRHCDALVLPSLAECGGAVVLEAMAMGIPVIATAWGGPADYLDPSCGILVEPASREAFIDNLTLALIRLAHNREERIAMGNAGRLKVIRDFDWESKLDGMLEIYRQAIATSSATPN